MSETTPPYPSDQGKPYTGDAADETAPSTAGTPPKARVSGDTRPIGVISACRRIRKELEENLAYARLYQRLCKRAKNHEGIQQWQDQVDQLVEMLAELDKEEAHARAGIVRLEG